ncbi:MAG: glycine cleavage system protein GcvH [Verrucomicrobia bacterium]|nr:glycine cleavage system protein GcvH [Verrucomicrobiota bacterium]MBS0646634.1 glycine cleavage system protein GcvH [Verrucomicrobiota bacterium]
MKYSISHEWVESYGEEVKVGISHHFQAQLDDIVYVELPKVGFRVKKGDEVAVLESTKAAIDMTSPVSGVIVAVNTRLKEEPALVNQSAEKEGWIFRLQLDHPEELDQLLDAHSYQATLDGV